MDIYSRGCTDATDTGTGEMACDLKEYGDLTAFDVELKGTTYNVNVDTFLADIRANIMGKKTFPITDIKNFEDNTPDNEIATSGLGIEYDIRAGKPKFTTTFWKSGCAHARIFDKKDNEKWNVKFYFDKGILMAHTFDKTKFKGFDCGMFSVGTIKFKNGTNPQQTKVVFQLTNVEEFNKRAVFKTWEEVGADLNDENGVIETVVEYVGATTADGATTTVVDVKSACNGSAIAGLTGTTKWKIGGTQASATTISNVTESATVVGRYTITHTALAEDDTIQPTLNNGTYDAVEDVLLNKYAGKATLRTVVA